MIEQNMKAKYTRLLSRNSTIRTWRSQVVDLHGTDVVLAHFRPELYWKASRFLVNPLEMIASIIGETYAEAGGDAVFADDEALLI